MTGNQKFTNGAFVFSRPRRNIQPRDPAELAPLAVRHGLDEGIVPPYAGDRACCGRAIQSTSVGLYKEGFLLRPIKRSSKEVVYGIVREQRDDSSERLDHDHEATLRWVDGPDAITVHGSHPIAVRVADAYRDMRGKIVSEDWSAAITQFLESHGAVGVRGDGRVYWCPPQRVSEVKRLQSFLEEVGIDLILAELEPETKGVVRNVVSESLEEQLEKLQAEVDEFTGLEKRSTFSRRLELYQKLRERAVLYRDALGVGVDKTQAVLAELEKKVAGMLELRKSIVVHRDGSTGQVETAATQEEPDKQTQEALSDSPASASLRFAGADFTQADSDEPGVLRFVSDSESAVSSAKALENMGLTGWQKVGPTEVSIKNSGPPGETVQIRLKIPAGQDIQSVAKPLASIGIELAN